MGNISWPAILVVALVAVGIGGGVLAMLSDGKQVEILGPTGIIVAFLITKISDAHTQELARIQQRETAALAASAAREAGQAARDAGHASREAVKATVQVQENAVSVDSHLEHLTQLVTETQDTVKIVEKQTNSTTGALLRRTAEILRRFANQSEDPKDALIATSAEKDYEEHELAQARISAGAIDGKIPGRSAPAAPVLPTPATPPAAATQRLQTVILKGTIGGLKAEIAPGPAQTPPPEVKP